MVIVENPEKGTEDILPSRFDSILVQFAFEILVFAQVFGQDDQGFQNVVLPTITECFKSYWVIKKVKEFSAILKGLDTPTVMILGFKKSPVFIPAKVSLCAS